MSAKRKRMISAIFSVLVLYFASPYIQRWTNIYVGSLFVALVAYFWGKYFMFEEEYKEEMEKYNAWLDKEFTKRQEEIKKKKEE